MINPRTNVPVAHAKKYPFLSLPQGYSSDPKQILAAPGSPKITQEPLEDHQPLQRSLLKGTQTKGMQTKALSALAPSEATPESVFATEAAVTCNQRQSAEEEAEEKSCTCTQSELYHSG